jgi:hypothetical protein
VRACRVDRNQPEIVKHFRSCGFSVLHTHTLKNCFDILVAKDGVAVAIEIKDGLKPLSAQKLTSGEQRFADEWQGIYRIVRSIEEVDFLIMNWNNIQ